MSYLMLVPFLSAALYAQMPPLSHEPGKPPVPVDPTKPTIVEPAELGQSKPDRLGVRPAPGKKATAPAPTWRLFPAGQPAKPPSKWKFFPFGKSPAIPGAKWRLLPNGGSAQPAFVNRTLVPGNAGVIQQQGPCAIPLTNVLPSSDTPPTIRRVPIPEGQFPIKEVRPPAPSCDDRK